MCEMFFCKTLKRVCIRIVLDHCWSWRVVTVVIMRGLLALGCCVIREGGRFEAWGGGGEWWGVGGRSLEVGDGGGRWEGIGE